MDDYVKYLTPKEIADILKVSVRTIQRNITICEDQPSLMKAVRVGKRGLYRIPEVEFHRWLHYQPTKHGRQAWLNL
jgi:hypothetical protein